MVWNQLVYCAICYFLRSLVVDGSDEKQKTGWKRDTRCANKAGVVYKQREDNARENRGHEARGYMMGSRG